MTRRDLDFYPTGGGKRRGGESPSPVWAAQSLYRRLPMIRNIAEPCVGTGDLVVGRDDVLWTNDVDDKREATFHLNAAAPAAWAQFPRVPWVVTNPPFNLAHQVLSCALDFALEGVAFLLRISFLEPTEQRAHMLARRPPTRMIVLPRISFTGDGKTDNVTCVWLVWSKLVEPGIEVASRLERHVGAREQKKLPWA